MEEYFNWPLFGDSFLSILCDESKDVEAEAESDGSDQILEDAETLRSKMQKAETNSKAHNFWRSWKQN